MKPAKQFARSFKSFAEAWSAADAEGRYRLDERAAIAEHDGRATRQAAEAQALEERQTIAKEQARQPQRRCVTPSAGSKLPGTDL